MTVLAARVLGVGHGVADDGLKEDLEGTAGLVVDEARDALDAATASQAADGGLGDALDVVAEHLGAALGAALAQSLAAQALVAPANRSEHAAGHPAARSACLVAGRGASPAPSAPQPKSRGVRRG